MRTPLSAICLAGPTGAGKTAAALALAHKLNGEVINTDSRQTYKDFPIITAQPSEAEYTVCTHHLYAFMPTEEKLSAGRWAERAVACVRDVLARGKVPLLVGGTGLYFRTVLEGMANIPPVPEHISAHFVARLQVEGREALHEELKHKDPVAAARIHPHDSQRIARALEVLAATGKTLSYWHTQNAPPPLRALYMGIHTALEQLTPRLNMRIEHMLKSGALDEANAAYARCADGNAPAWSGIGCAELHAYMSGTISFDEAVLCWQKNTRAYAKRQLTWFRAVKHLRWFEGEDVDGMIDAAKTFWQNT